MQQKTEEFPSGHSRAELTVISGAGPRGHISCIKRADTSCGFSVGDCPNSLKPNRRGQKFYRDLFNPSSSGKEMQMFTSSITSTNIRASSPERHSNTPTSSRSEKMVFIKEMCSFVERVESTSRLHGGGSLNIKSQTHKWIAARMNEKLTSREEFARLPRLPGASEGVHPSTVGSISTTLL